MYMYISYHIISYHINIIDIYIYTYHDSIVRAPAWRHAHEMVRPVVRVAAGVRRLALVLRRAAELGLRADTGHRWGGTAPSARDTRTTRASREEVQRRVCAEGRTARPSAVARPGRGTSAGQNVRREMRDEG